MYHDQTHIKDLMGLINQRDSLQRVTADQKASA